MKKLVIFSVLVMSTRAAMGLLFMNPVCRFAQNDSCYGAVGRPLYLQLESEDQLDLKKNISGTASGYIFRFKKQKITQNHSDYPRWQFVTNNSTMIINSAEKRDSGRYTLDTFNSTGISKGIYHPQLVIEAVVSSVTVTDSCLSIEKRKVYCSSDGDNVRYNWTYPHIQLADGNQTLLLDKEATGSVTCYAENHVSRGHKTIELQQCPDMLLIVLGSTVVVLIVLSIISYLIYRKKQAPKNIGSSQNDGELLYVQVTHKPTGGADKTGGKAQAQGDDVEYATVITQPKQKKKKQAEDEVQYGEVAFNTGGAKHRREQPKEQDECVYSQVHHNR
ncbi:uncharacterized protein LOC118821445 [Colossoma macropomum]|uniref:uncharacterized protein LOC118821445 n=1 Tax=Colossoma macropomum TaxID=42526 RepID=UPI001863AF48|nr:uncharacterized protein LOC118821445 [Colossoma macropomum]